MLTWTAESHVPGSFQRGPDAHCWRLWYWRAGHLPRERKQRPSPPFSFAPVGFGQGVILNLGLPALAGSAPQLSPGHRLHPAPRNSECAPHNLAKPPLPSPCRLLGRFHFFTRLSAPISRFCKTAVWLGFQRPYLTHPSSPFVTSSHTRA